MRARRTLHEQTDACCFNHTINLFLSENETKYVIKLHIISMRVNESLNSIAIKE